MRYLPCSFEKGHVGARVRFFVKKKSLARVERETEEESKGGETPRPRKGSFLGLFFARSRQ